MTKVRRQILGTAAALALAIAGCGGDEEQPPAARDLTQIRCPMEATGDEVGGVEQYRPAEDSFNTAELIGEPLEEARATAAEHGCEIEVAMADGEGLPVPTDVDPERIYVYTEDDVVTEIEGVGGGI